MDVEATGGPIGRGGLTDAAARRALSLSLVEGVVWALMVGCAEAYFLADAIRLGASALEQGLVITLPLFAGSTGPVIALRALARLPRRKGFVVGAVAVQAALLLALAAAHHAGVVTPAMLIGFACVHQVCGQAAGTAWGSWFGDLVPSEIRGRYFARRNRGVHVATLCALVAAGLVLQGLEPGAPGEVLRGAGGDGFRWIFAAAGGFRIVSAVLLALSPEPEFRGIPTPRRLLQFVRTERGTGAWRFLAVGAALHLCVYVSAPYFGPFMLEELRFSYVEYMTAGACVVVTKVAFLPLWGRLVDAHGARSVFGLAALLVALVPLPWIWADGLAWVLPAQGLSGACWAAHEVAYFALLLDSSYATTRPHLLAAQNVLNGAAQLSGGLVGAALLALGGADFRVVFAVSLAGRLILAMLAPHLVRAPGTAPATGRRALLARVVGMRAHGGLVHGAVTATDEDEPG